MAEVLLGDEVSAEKVAKLSSTISKWWQRDNIPPNWWSRILGTAVARAARLTSNKMTLLASRMLAEAREC